MPPDYGALVISLDLELHWGMRDRGPLDSATRTSLLASRAVVPQLLELFDEFSVSATWATVGFLFARSRDELRRYQPLVRPQYDDRRLDPYEEAIGEGEEEDPLHYGASLVAQIRAHPGQELATHTFSHYYALEPKRSAEAFAADLASAAAIAAGAGVRPRSIVFPRNQFNPDYGEILLSMGIECYRGTQDAWMWRAAPNGRQSAARRAARLLDAYVGGASYGTRWQDVLQPSGLFDVSASHFLRPCCERLRHLEGLRRERIIRGLRAAASSAEIFHLWWHPHNFGLQPEENLAFLRSILEEFALQRDRGAMRSLSMSGVADELRAP